MLALVTMDIYGNLPIRIKITDAIHDDAEVAKFSSMSVALAAYDQCLITYKNSRVQLLDGARLVRDSEREKARSVTHKSQS